MPQTFSATIEQWAEQAKQDITRIFRQSVERVVTEMQTEGPSVASVKKEIEKGLGAKGRGKSRKLIQGPVRATFGPGNLPVDTGFLRASLVISKDGPKPMTRANPGGEKFEWDAPAASLVINGADVGETIFASYTANYAAMVNYGANGKTGRQFVGLAAQRWNSIVADVSNEVRSRSK